MPQSHRQLMDTGVIPLRRAPPGAIIANPEAPPAQWLRTLSQGALGRWHGAICAEMKYRLGGPDPLSAEARR